MSRENIIEYNLSDCDLKYGTDNINDKRTYFAGIPSMTKDFQSEVTIWIQAYNYFDKTKRCIESVLKYTKDVDYDLILVDNNAGDETYEYFKAIDYPKKTVIHFNKNTGSAYPFTVVPIDMISKYFVLLNNDLIVTKNWLTNLLTIMKSDSRIGVVNPSSNNVSNYQCMEFEFDTYEQMQAVAEQINVSDKTKWEERMRVVTLGTLISKECLYAMGWPLFDMGFSHNFMDDDMSFRARRAGYKVIVTRDTWICHDHLLEGRENDIQAENFNRDMIKFCKKYYGIVPGDDTNNNSIAPIPGLLDKINKVDNEKISILGIDVRCGMPILDIKNMFPYGKDISTSAYIQDAKYYVDVNTICNGKVVCDKEENIKYNLQDNLYDYIIIGEAINMYNNPVRVISEAYDMLKKNGQMIFSLKNTRNMISLLCSLGYEISGKQGIYQDIALDDLYAILMDLGIEIASVTIQEYEDAHESVYDLTNQILDKCGDTSSNMNEVIARIKADKFWMTIKRV